MPSLYVTVTAECEIDELLSNWIFPSELGQEFIEESRDDDGDKIAVYKWNGEMEPSIKQNLNRHRDVIDYQILS